MKTLLRRYVSWFWREWLRPLALAAVIVFPLKSAVADWNYVPSGSMIPSILPGELVWINKLAYDLKVPFTTMHLAEWGNPRRGDVIVFYSPADGTRLVKRVIGLPGDVIESRNDRLYINGAPLAYTGFAGMTQPVGVPEGALLEEERLAARLHPVMVLPDTPALRTFGPVRVPSGQYFAMGDNRDNSHDSRFFGCVARDRILGRATTVVASVDLDRYGQPRFGRFGSGIP
ncbi:MAG TPA: signal peptidase I [Opitutaceae bacterium]|nr:signal peptidase I [Opitutaceae bacterium]